jgi:hypothetical protein
MWTCQGNLIILVPFPFLALGAKCGNLMLVVHGINPRCDTVIARSQRASPGPLRHSPAPLRQVQTEVATPIADSVKATKQSLGRYRKHRLS